MADKGTQQPLSEQTYISMDAHPQSAHIASQSEPFLLETPTNKPPLSKSGHVSIQPIEPYDGESQYGPGNDAALPRSQSVYASKGLNWRPFYLRRRVLAAFFVVFALIVIAIEVLLLISTRNDGLNTASKGQHYLWTYGPAAFLTLVAAVFSRIEFQSKISAPWEQLAKRSPKAAETLLLDYLSEFQPVTVCKSLANRDFTVAATTVISLLVKVMIVLSTGLITLTLTRVHVDAAPMTLQDTFVNSNAALADADKLPYYIMQGFIGSNLTYPAGISQDFAYQSVNTGLSSTTAQSQVSVDGLTNALACETLEVNMTGAEPPDPRYAERTMNFTITAADCDMKLRLQSPEITLENENATSLLFARFADGQCEGTSDNAGRRVLIMIGSLAYYEDTSVNETDYTGQVTVHPTYGRLLESTQLLCSPTYTITTVDVVQNGTNVDNVTLSDGAANHTLDAVDAWDIMDAHFAAYVNSVDNADSFYSTSIIYLEGQPQTAVDTDAYASFMLQFGVPAGMNLSALYNQTTLQQVATDYYRQFGAIVAKQFMMESASTPTTGKFILLQNRLVVRAWSAQVMAGLAGACCLLTLACTFTVSRRGVVPRDPNTLHGMAAIMSQSSAILRKLRDLGDADRKILQKNLRTATFRSELGYIPSAGQCHYSILLDTDADKDETDGQCKTAHAHPTVLNPAVRAVLGVILLGTIVALELTLQKSNREEGLGDVADDTYIHYLWTSLPSVFLGLLAMAFSSIDFKTRSLIPYLLLRKGVSTSTFTTFHLLDSSVPHALWREMRLKNVGAVATTATLLVASFFTVFSGSLFQEVTLSVTQNVTMRANTSFPVDEYSLTAQSDGGIAASLILASNLTYPSFTYENLVFPQFDVNTSMLGQQLQNSTVDLTGQSIQATLPAVRGALTCRMYDSSSITTNLTLNYTSADLIENPLWVDIYGEDCRSSDVLAKPGEFEDTQYWYSLGFGVETNMTYFGQGGFSLDGNNGCSDILFVWGQFDFANADEPISYIAGMGCNNSFETVQVQTTFVGSGTSGLDIDAANPPQAVEATAHNTTSSNVVSSMYYYLADVHTSELLSNVFAMLTTSRWAIPVSMLGGTSNATGTDNRTIDTAQEIGEALQFQHSIILAQVVNNNRVAANTTNATLAYPPPASLTDENDATPVYAATVTDASARRRVAQDAVSTRTLEALLAAAFVLLVIGSISVRNTDVLAASPTSIASVVALLAGGNLVQEMTAANAKGAEAEDVKRVFGPDTRFWLGWGNMPDEDGIRTGNENQAGVSRFGIYAIRDGAEKQPDPTGRHTDSDVSSVLLGAE